MWWTKRKKPKVSTGFNQRDKFQAFYQSAAWQRTRLIIIAEQVICQRCLRNGLTTVGTEVNHIIPLQEDYSRRLDYTNLELCCKPCHSITTIEEARARRQKEIDRYMDNLNSF